MRPRHTEAQWRKIFDQFSQSGMSQEQFCQREDLALSTFDRWRRTFRESSLAAIPASFVELCVPNVPTPVVPLIPESVAELVVELPFGVVLRFRGVRP
jgi:transposase-like protein